MEKNSFKFDTYKGMVKDEAVRKISARIREECYLAKGKIIILYITQNYQTFLRMVKMGRMGAL